MGDLFGRWVPREWIERVLRHVERYPRTTFLFLTKNPARYLEFRFPPNAILGATMETNRDELAERVSRAPPPSERFRAMVELEHHWKFVSIEPILDFDLEVLVAWMRRIGPRLIYVGYDNYGSRLPEPPLEKTLRLIERLRRFTEVREKTLRPAWHEAGKGQLSIAERGERHARQVTLLEYLVAGGERGG